MGKNCGDCRALGDGSLGEMQSAAFGWRHVVLVLPENYLPILSRFDSSSPF
jgi:hypothetical protein